MERIMNVPEDLKYAESHEWVRVADEAGPGAVALDPEAELDLLEARR